MSVRHINHQGTIPRNKFYNRSVKLHGFIKKVPSFHRITKERRRAPFLWNTVYIADKIPHWCQQRVVHPCAFQPVCSQDSTCRWQGRKADQAGLPVNGKNDSGCTGRSVTINSHHMLQTDMATGQITLIAMIASRVDITTFHKIWYWKWLARSYEFSFSNPWRDVICTSTYVAAL